MIIENVAASFPTRKVGNEEVVDLIRFHSKNFEGDLQGATRAVKAFLDHSGLVTRHWQAKNERPIEHLAHAVSGALKGSGLQPADIDLLVYVGVGGGFREPGNSYMVAKSLGMSSAQCFDIIDASMSWTRALSLVDSLFKTEQYRNALIVNAEFNMTGGGPELAASFSLQHPSQLDHSLLSYTIGEAATATLLRPDRPDNFLINFQSKPDLVDLCFVPGGSFGGFCQETDGANQPGAGPLNAVGHELHLQLDQALDHLFATEELSPQQADIVFTHTSSSAAWRAATARHGLADKVYDLYPRTGNIVSASIPGALALAREEGRLNAGDEVLFLMGTAGMCFAAGRFKQ